jgi:hypothetical protein
LDNKFGYIYLNILLLSQKIINKMAKKIDIKRTLGSPIPALSVDTIEEMTRMIHAKKEESLPAPTAAQSGVESIQTKEKTTKKEPKETTKKGVEVAFVSQKEPSKRGRKPNPPATDERMIRVSVDLPESLFIQLKVKVIQEKTDMKTWVWRLVEKELVK